MRKSLLFIGLVVSLSAACSSSTPPDTTSTVRGKLSFASYTMTPTALIAVDESGAQARSDVASDGSFSLSLQKGHTYKLRVAAGPKEEPIVFPRSTGKLDTTFRVVSGAAVVELGNVRHFAQAPADGFVVMSGQAGSGQSADGQAGECVDGFIMGTGTACADDDGQDVSCEGGSEEAQGEEEATGSDPGPDIQCENGVDPNGQPCADEPDGTGDTDVECTNGVDPNGQACVDDDQDTADPAAEMSVPEHNPPDAVGGCDDGENVEE